MPCANIVNKTQIERTARVSQLEGLFELPPSKQSELSWNVNLPLEEKPWNIGLIAGASGSGKTTIARNLFNQNIIEGYDWHKTKSIVDDFPKDMSIKEITLLLSSVGFSSPPAWLRPFHALSNGQQFRVTMARALAENNDLIVLDEFTSVIDRQVAQVGSAAVQKAIRRSNKQFIALSCHYDIIEWLQPDWIYEPETNQFQWRCLWRRPDINLKVQRVDSKAWKLFSQHHYLNHQINKSASCFVAFFENEPVAFTSVLSFPHAKRSGWREHRTVCLPDFQGVGIGNAISELIASAYVATNKPYFSVTSNPAMINHRAKSKLWKLKRNMSKAVKLSKTSNRVNLGSTLATKRLTASFEYIGKPNLELAKGLSLSIK